MCSRVLILPCCTRRPSLVQGTHLSASSCDREREDVVNSLVHVGRGTVRGGARGTGHMDVTRNSISKDVRPTKHQPRNLGAHRPDGLLACGRRPGLRRCPTRQPWAHHSTTTPFRRLILTEVPVRWQWTDARGTPDRRHSPRYASLPPTRHNGPACGLNETACVCILAAL